MIIFLLPRGYSLSPLKNLLSEVLSYKSMCRTNSNKYTYSEIGFFFSFVSNDKIDNIIRLYQSENCTIH